MLATTKLALENRKYPYNTIAQVVIKDLKAAGDFLQTGQFENIAPSKNLQQLAASAKEPVASVTIPKEPRAAAVALLKNFNKQQLTQILQMVSSQL